MTNFSNICVLINVWKRTGSRNLASECYPLRLPSLPRSIRQWTMKWSHGFLPTLLPPIIYPFFLMTRARIIIPCFDSLCIYLLKGVQKPWLSLPKQSKIHLRSSPAGAKFFPMVFIAWFTSQIKKVISKPAHDLDLTLCSLRCCCCTITSSCGSTVCVTEFLALKHKSRILGHSSNTVCTVHTTYSVRSGTTKKLTL